MLITWANFLQDRRCKPSNIGQILTESLFDNTFLPTLKDRGKQLTFLPDWCRAEITEIQDLTYGVILKLLPCEAIKELLSKATKQTEKQHAMVMNQKSYASILKQNSAPTPQPRGDMFSFTADQLVKFVATVAIQIAQPQVCYTTAPKDAVDKKSNLCRRVSEAAKSQLGVSISGSTLFDAIGSLRVPVLPASKIPVV